MAVSSSAKAPKVQTPSVRTDVGEHPHTSDSGLIAAILEENKGLKDLCGRLESALKNLAEGPGNDKMLKVLQQIADRKPESGLVLKHISVNRNADGFAESYDMEWE